MTHTSQEINKIAARILLRAFKDLSQTGKAQFLSQLMVETPEYYLEFISYIDQRTYKKVVGQA